MTTTRAFTGCRMIYRLFTAMLAGGLLIGALSACDRKDGKETSKAIAVDEPNRFAQFINPIAVLPSGDYRVVAATNTAGENADFTLTITYDDATVESHSGSWTASGGIDETSVANPSFPITLQTAGGIDIKLESSVDTYLFLLTADGSIFAQNNDIDVAAGITNSQITLVSSRLDSEAFGAAYYAAVDPNNDKDTLEKWKMMNGYYEALMANRVVEPRFRDTKDLGYGRGMRMWSQPDGSLYFFVENFQVRTIPGLEYTALNLDALIMNDRQHHFGSNAIEFSTFPYGAGEPSDIGSTHKFAKFYTFDATQGDQTAEDHESETRLNRVNLDSRGLKAMPGACVYCHGGTERPLRADGTFRDNTLNGSAGNGINGDTNAKLQLLEVPSFEFWDESPYTKAEQEVPIKQVNEAIYCTYPNLPPEGIMAACAQFCVDPADTANCDANGNDITAIFSTSAGSGEWSGAFAREMAEGWYDDPAVAGMFDRATFNDDYVPPAWRPNAITGSPPAGSDQLFLEVVQPICFVCHSRRGTSLGSDQAANGTQDIDFSSYDKFISHADLIKRYVFDYGIMPLSLRGFNAFWGSDGPLVLASHINGQLAADNQVATNSANFIDQPAAAVADAGPDITTTSPVRTFGSNSRFVDSYSWSIVSTPVGGEAATLTDADKPRALLTAPVDGDYVLRLVAAHGSSSDQDVVTLKIDSAMSPAPQAINFVADIKPIFTQPGDDTNACEDCHQTSGGGGISGIPVWWRDDGEQPVTGTTFYNEVLARVDFNDPANSLFLIKPTGNHHFGGLRSNGYEVNNPSNRFNYDLVLNWIMNGARYDANNMRQP